MQTPSVAQTFVIPEQYPAGIWCTSVTLYFELMKANETDSVQVDLIGTINGYPESTDTPIASVILTPDKITADAKKLVPVKVPFGKLVYLAPNVEYALKLTTNSNGYKVWTSMIGQPRVDAPASLIIKQPTLGSFFKSQNGSTWSAEQLQDLTFAINMAKFDINKVGTIKLIDKKYGTSMMLPQNPFKYTNGSTTVVVRAPSHGLEVGMKVTFIGSNDATFNTTFLVAATPTNDTFQITLGAAATTTNFVGGDGVEYEKTIRYDTFVLNGVVETSSARVKSFITPSSATAVDSAKIEIIPGQYIDMTQVKYVHTSVNKDFLLSGKNSLTIDLHLYSTDVTQSPIINLDAVGTTLIGNKINSNSVAQVDYNVDGTVLVVGSSNISFAATTNKITVPSTFDYSKIKVGAHVKITDAGGTNDGKTGTVSEVDSTNNIITLVDATLATQASRSATITQYDTYVDDFAPTGSTSVSKYVSKVVRLKNQSTGFKVIFQANVHTDADLEMWYRTTSGEELDNKNYIKQPITYNKSKLETDFTEYEYDITNIEPFDKFQFKFVFKSTNVAVTPKLKMLRIIALA